MSVKRLPSIQKVAPDMSWPERLANLTHSVHAALLWLCWTLVVFVIVVRAYQFFSVPPQDPLSRANEASTTAVTLPTAYLEAVPGSALVPTYHGELKHPRVRFYVYHQHTAAVHTTRVEAWTPSGETLWVLWMRGHGIVPPAMGLFTPEGAMQYVSHPHPWISEAGNPVHIDMPDWDDTLHLAEGLTFAAGGVLNLPAMAMVAPSPADFDVANREPDACIELPVTALGARGVPYGARLSKLHSQRCNAAVWMSEVTRLLLALRHPHPKNVSQSLTWSKGTEDAVVLQNAPARDMGGYYHVMWHACESEGVWKAMCLRLRACAAHVPPDRSDRNDCAWTLPNGTRYARVPCECVREAYASMELAELGMCGVCTQESPGGCACWAHWLAVEELLLQQPCVQRMLCRGRALDVPSVRKGVVEVVSVHVAVHCWVGMPHFRGAVHLTPHTLHLF